MERTECDKTNCDLPLEKAGLFFLAKLASHAYQQRKLANPVLSDVFIMNNGGTL